MKKCFSCNEIKNLFDFYAHAKMADGHLNKCIVCCKSYAVKRREECETPRILDKKRYKNNLERRKYSQDNSKKWRIKNPEKYKAQTCVNNAIRDGKLIKQPCCICGDKKSHAHHSDYSKPLFVTWLCARCHAIEHRDRNNEQKNITQRSS